MQMTIAIIGAGNVGGTLGRRIAASGEAVYFGVPGPAKYARLATEIGAGTKVGSVAEAVAAADIAILAVPYGAALETVRSVGDWHGRILVDATNPIAPGLAGLTVGTTSSGAEEIARAARNARVVKAFNTTGYDNMARPQYPGGAVFMPVCGDDPQARTRVLALVTRIGFDAVDCGPLSAARYLEPFAMTWIHLALRQGLGRDFAFGLLRR
jgi:8-hydroxy-5-deazaflavin:NADPH oxidoreductase